MNDTDRQEGSPARQGSLSARIFVRILALTIVPVAIVAGQGYHCAHQALVDSARREMLRTALAYANQLEGWIREREADLVFLAGRPVIQEALPIDGNGGESANASGPAAAVLADLTATQKAYQNLALFDCDWQPIVQASPRHHESADFDLSTIKQRVAAKRAPAVSCLHRHADDGVGIHVGVPVAGSEGGEPAGYLLAALDLTHRLGPLLATGPGLGKTGKVCLLDESARVIAASWPIDETGAAREPFDREALRAEIETPHGAGEYVDLRGHDVVGGHARLAGVGGTLIVELDRSEALEWAGILAMRASVVGLLTILAVAAFSGSIARRLARPMRVLARVAGRIRDGERGARVPELEGREAAAVGKALNEMLDELEETHRRLVHAATLAAVGEFSSSIVHEIRNPLSSIKLNLQALEQFARDDATHAELAGIAREQTLRIERMLGDLLAFSRPLEMALEESPLAGVIEQAVREVQSTADERKITITTHGLEGPIRIVVDRDRMAQALVNLLRNALQAAGGDGRIDIRCERRSHPRPLIVIEVCDNGPGLAEENMDRLFRPFFTTRDEGTGLGLANVKKIVEYHGGTVTGRNREDASGAVFTVTLPLARRAS